MAFAVLVFERIGEDGAVKLGSSSLRERQRLPSFASFDQAAPILGAAEAPVAGGIVVRLVGV